MRWVYLAAPGTAASGVVSTFARAVLVACFVWAALAAAGLALIVPKGGTDAPLDPVGLGFAVCAATCWGLYIVFGKRASGLVHGGRATALGMAMAAAVTLPFGVEAEVDTWQKSLRLVDSPTS